MDHEPHSARYLNDTRDLWWNADYLALIAARTGLGEATRVLDCGAGLGHWTRTVARLAKNADVIGLEREPAWVARASAGAPARVSFCQGDVQALPFADGSFDVVTCQTLLIHLREPRSAVREMVRVLRRGGRLLLCEPNNLAEGVARLCVLPSFDLDDVAAWNNDLCMVFAPGESAAARAARPEIVEEQRMLADGGFTWARDEALRYFCAGGGRDDEFEPLLARARRAWACRIDALTRGTLSQNCGGLFYVVSARKR